MYFCPHAKDEGCACRKPRPGLLLRARDELGLDMHDAVFIRDSITDIRASLIAGIKAILVLSGLGLEQFRAHHQEINGPFRIALNLQHAAELLLKASQVLPEPQSPLECACYVLPASTEQLDSLLPL